MTLGLAKFNTSDGSKAYAITEKDDDGTFSALVTSENAVDGLTPTQPEWKHGLSYGTEPGQLHT